MSPEVLIYIQTIKNFFEKNEEARKYFLNEINVNLFFDHITECSQKNYDKEGVVEVSRIQFETIRTSLITNKSNKEEEKISFNTHGFGKIYLN